MNANSSRSAEETVDISTEICIKHDKNELELEMIVVKLSDCVMMSAREQHSQQGSTSRSQGHSERVKRNICDKNPNYFAHHMHDLSSAKDNLAPTQ